MPAWIHQRARHIQAKNPEMDESAAFAIATQQAHKLKKTPKGYGTSEGKKKARKKYQGPKKSYTQGADPQGVGKKLESKLKKEAMIDPRFDLAVTQSFRDEVIKIAASSKEASKVGDLARSFGTALKGSKLTKPVMKDQGRISKALGRKLKALEVGGEAVTKKVPLSEALKDPDLKGEALKTLGARGAAGGAAAMGGIEYSKAKKKQQRQRMGKAYISGARDMYSRVSRRR